MAKPEEHYAVALDLANEIGVRLLLQPVDERDPMVVLDLSRIHVELGNLQLAIQRPGRSLIVPNGRLH